MSREFDDIRRKIEQTNKELHTNNNHSDNNQDQKILSEINQIKKEIKNIAFKVDTMLEILNNFSIMLIEDDESDNNQNESWIPEQEEDWNSYDDEDEED